MKRTHTKEQDEYIKKMKFKYITAESHKEKEYYARVLSLIEFF